MNNIPGSRLSSALLRDRFYHSPGFWHINQAYIGLSSSSCIPLTSHRRSIMSHSHSTTDLMEEETTGHYDRSRYYPVHLGQTFNTRYKTSVKLGYGGYSTVWLCHDTTFVASSF